MFVRAARVDGTVGPGRVVGHELEGAGVERGIEPRSELVHGPVGGLLGDNDLVELPDCRVADGATVADFAMDSVEGCQVVLQVVGILVGAGRRDCRGFEAVLDEGLDLAFAQPVDALDDAGLDGRAAVERRLASDLDL